MILALFPVTDTMNIFGSFFSSDDFALNQKAKNFLSPLNIISHQDDCPSLLKYGLQATDRPGFDSEQKQMFSLHC
jgi:hypothetical protein